MNLPCVSLGLGLLTSLKNHEDLKRLDDSLEVTHSGMENGIKGGDKGPVSFLS